jgi:hypothetical protein
MTKWSVGDQVAVVPHYRNHGVKGPFAVTDVTLRKVTLSDGSEWSVTSGYQWGSGRERWYTGPRLEMWTERHVGEVDRHQRKQAHQRLLKRLESADILPWSVIHAIEATLDALSKQSSPSGK